MHKHAHIHTPDAAYLERLLLPQLRHRQVLAAVPRRVACERLKHPPPGQPTAAPCCTCRSSPGSITITPDLAYKALYANPPSQVSRQRPTLLSRIVQHPTQARPCCVRALAGKALRTPSGWREHDGWGRPALCRRCLGEGRWSLQQLRRALPPVSGPCTDPRGIESAGRWRGGVDAGLLLWRQQLPQGAQAQRGVRKPASFLLLICMQQLQPPASATAAMAAPRRGGLRVRGQRCRHDTDGGLCEPRLLCLARAPARIACTCARAASAQKPSVRSPELLQRQLLANNGIRQRLVLRGAACRAVHNAEGRECANEVPRSEVLAGAHAHALACAKWQRNLSGGVPVQVRILLALRVLMHTCM